MIKGKQKSKLTKENILRLIDTYDIYRFYQGPFNVNKPCVNHHRGEKEPSLIIGNKISENLTHKDLGDYTWRGDCFHFVQQVHRCDFTMALYIIDRDFNLGLNEGKMIEVKPSIITWETPKLEAKKPPLFQIVHYPKMGKRHSDYWSRLCQGEDDLRVENVFQIKELWRNKKKIPLGDLLTFGYYYPSIDCWKLYRPFAPKRTEKTPINQWKWDSNVPFDYVDGLENITPDCKKVFLTKSKKDKMVWKKALQTNCIADCQAEDPACLNDLALSKFKEVDERWIGSDNDKKGKEFSWWLTKEHGFKHVNVPDKHLIIEPKSTDFADICWNYNLDAVVSHFKKKGLL